MKNLDEKSTQGSPQRGLPTSVEGDEVRATMEQARQALEASRSEIQRAKRLLRETEELADAQGGSKAEDSGDARIETR